MLIKNEILDEIYQENKIKKPSYAQYLIVGGGTAAVAAFKAIKANDPKAKVKIWNSQFCSKFQFFYHFIRFS